MAKACAHPLAVLPEDAQQGALGDVIGPDAGVLRGVQGVEGRGAFRALGDMWGAGK